MRVGGITLGLVALLALALGASPAAADPPEGSNGHHNATPTPSPRSTPSPTPTVGPTSPATPAGEADPTAGTKPPGNNGVVKVDARPFDDAPDNEPHVGCTFQIDFYGYDEGDLEATYLLELHSPTGSGTLLTGTTPIGEDPAGGGTDLDASVTIDLEDEVAASGADPHPKQGYHVKLTVHAEGSIGADTKHKVFWVTCSPPLGTTVTPPPPTMLPPTPGPPVPTVPTVQPTVLPSTITPPKGLAFTGRDLEGIALAFALLLFGTAALRASHRRERRHYNRW